MLSRRCIQICHKTKVALANLPYKSYITDFVKDEKKKSKSYSFALDILLYFKKVTFYLLFAFWKKKLIGFKIV